MPTHLFSIRAKGQLFLLFTILSLSLPTLSTQPVLAYTIDTSVTALQEYNYGAGYLGAPEPNYVSQFEVHTDDGIYSASLDTGIVTTIQRDLPQINGMEPFDLAGIARGSVSVDLAAGTIRAFAEAGGYQRATAYGSFTEQIFDFRWADPTRTDPINLTFRLSANGFFGVPSYNTECAALFGIDACIQNRNYGYLSARFIDETGGQAATGLRYDFSPLFGNTILANNSFHFGDTTADPDNPFLIHNLVLPGHVYSFQMTLFLDQYTHYNSAGCFVADGTSAVPTCSYYEHGYLDMMHTFGVSLDAPEGVTYQSSSGIFLTQTPTAGVPEPSTLLLSLTGLLSYALWRKRTNSSHPH